MGRYGLGSDAGASTLSSSSDDDTVTSGCDSEMEDRNWSMSAFCSWSSSSAGGEENRTFKVQIRHAHKQNQGES